MFFPGAWSQDESCYFETGEGEKQSVSGMKRAGDSRNAPANADEQEMRNAAKQVQARRDNRPLSNRGQM